MSLCPACGALVGEGSLSCSKCSSIITKSVDNSFDYRAGEEVRQLRLMRGENAFDLVLCDSKGQILSGHYTLKAPRDIMKSECSPLRTSILAGVTGRENRAILLDKIVAGLQGLFDQMEVAEARADRQGVDDEDNAHARAHSWLMSSRTTSPVEATRS